MPTAPKIYSCGVSVERDKLRGGDVREGEVVVVEFGVNERGADGEERDVEGPNVLERGFEVEERLSAN